MRFSRTSAAVFLWGFAAFGACGGRGVPGLDPGRRDAGGPDGRVACLPTTCDGCCNAEGECVTGQEAGACGRGGEQCADCAVLGGRCQEGQCVEETRECGPGTCPGCCDEQGRCLAGVWPSACGRGGEACRDCGAGVCGEGECRSGCRDEDGDGYGPGCALGPDCDDQAPGVTGPCQDNGCPQGWAYVPAGPFQAGCLEEDVGSPLMLVEHEGRTGAYCIQLTEVPVRDYRACVQAGWCGLDPGWLPDYPPARTDCNWSDEGADRPDHPMNCLPFRAMEHYCRAWLGGDLPTDEEWEKAARGTDGRPYPWGSEPELTSDMPEMCQYANIYSCGLQAGGEAPTWEVGHLGDRWTSPYGLRDVVGNVVEVTRTLWEEPDQEVRDTSDEETEVSARGGTSASGLPCTGGFLCTHYALRDYLLCIRYPPSLGTSAAHQGFRCVRRLSSEEAGDASP